MVRMYNRVKEVLTSILDRFKSGDIPEAIAYSMFPIPNIPAAKWSLCNRMIMFFAGTQDARGYGQWRKAKRHVKKNAKAFHILAPKLVKKENNDGEEELFIAGFVTVSVFRVEDTDGEPLDYVNLQLPELPLIEVAEKWGLSVQAVPGNYSYYGYYSDNRKQIALATKEEIVFFHELSHAAHAKVLGILKSGQDWKQEIVAELSASVLCCLVGKDNDKYLGNAYAYIERYASETKIGVFKACMLVISDVEKVLKLILELEVERG